jgi:flagellar hook-basal body complex protein FliE
MRITATEIMALRGRILEQNKNLSEVNQLVTAAPGTSPTAPASFGNHMADALKSVSAVQSEAGKASDAFERGETTNIAELMLARQKSSLAFQATLQVRNRLLSTYKDIMNMPV